MIDTRKLTDEQERRIIAQFDCFCKKVIRNEARNIEAARRRCEKHPEVPYDALRNIPGPADEYPSDVLEMPTRAGKIMFENMTLFDALQCLPENQREALLLKHFRDWSDERIAQEFGVVTRTVRKWRHLAVAHMTKILERSIPNESTDG